MKEVLERKNIDIKYKWDLTKFCPNDNAWLIMLEELKAMIPQISQFKGKLNNKEILLDFFKFDDKISNLIRDLNMYVSNNLNVELDNSHYNEFDGMLCSVFTKLEEEMSFYSPEMLSYNDDYLKDLQSDIRFKDYDFSFLKLRRMKQHVLSEKEEKIISKVGNFSGDYSELLQTYFAVDMKCPNAIDSKGNPHLLTNSTYYSLLINKDRELRKSAYTNYSSTVMGISNTLTRNYISSIKKDKFYAQSSNFEDVLSERLYSDDIDKMVYKKLIANAHSKLDLVEKYHTCKRKLLGYDNLFMWDRLCSMVTDNEQKFDFETSCEILKKALNPLGNEYVEVLDIAIKERWFDVYPTKGKRGGAYMSAMYGKTPLVFLNHTDDFDSVSTLAHEFGHAMHSYYSNSAQPREKADYTIFCAEIASTTNEVLLNEYFLNKTPKEHESDRLYYLNSIVNTFMGTFFRQSMFSEFEEFAHDLVDNDKPISKDILDNKYLELNKLYLPAMEIDDNAKCSWIQIPHFYSSFYVYKYATGIVCAINFASKILNNEVGALENYKKFLCSGASDFSLNILKNCGIDLSTDAPYKVAFDFISNKLNEIENIAEKKTELTK